MFPGDTTAAASPSATALHGADEGAVLFRAQHVGRLLVHSDDLRRRDELETARVEAGRAEDDRLDAVGARGEGAFDHGLGAAVSSHRIDGNPAHGRRAYGAWVRSGSTSRPLYEPQVGQTRCGRFGWSHVGQTLTFGRLDLVRRAPLVAT